MTRPHMGAAIVLGGLALLAVGGFAAGQSAKMSPADTVATRQRLMKLNGASWQDAQAKIKAGNIEAVAVNAETMAIIATQITMLFPEGSMTDQSKAKPEIWQKWPEFEAAAKNMQTEAEKLRDAAKSKDAAATEAVAKDFGRQACGTCHTPFRVPPKS
ncbi:MAG TPA: cytochrome c [Candidatus Methylomirabilis sp.]|nr:cytochrome c [Candidatus Methylomirabilis sp.]